jgi:hypothetical protein
MGGTQSKAGRGPKGYQRSDDRIREDVCEHLTQDHDIDASDIEVKVEHGQVTLSGTIDDRMARRRVEDIVESCSGVKDVQNQLRVNQQGSQGNQGSASSATGSNSHGQGSTQNAGAAGTTANNTAGTQAQASTQSKEDEGSQNKKR